MRPPHPAIAHTRRKRKGARTHAPLHVSAIESDSPHTHTHSHTATQPQPGRSSAVQGVGHSELWAMGAGAAVRGADMQERSSAHKHTHIYTHTHKRGSQAIGSTPPLTNEHKARYSS